MLAQAFLFSVILQAAADTLILSPQAQVPGNASSLINSSFIGLAFEACSLPDYANASNTFSHNLVQNIVDRIGTRPVVRIGGTSLDHSFYNRSLNTWADIPGNNDSGVVKNVTFGPPFFDILANWSNVTYTIECPLAYLDLNQTLEFAEDAYRILGPDKISAFEIGNEPDLYTVAGPDRPQGYGPQQWVEEWTNYSTAISNALNLSTSERNFQTLELSGNTAGWGAQDVFPDGLDNITQRISSTAYHYYDLQGSGDTELQGQLMNHTFTRNKMAYVADAASWLKTNHPDIPLMLNEVGSGEENNLTLVASFGAALWLADYMLYNMAIGVARVNYQQGTGFAFNLWQSTASDGRVPEVMPIYYGMLFAADFVGESGDMQVVEIGGQRDTLAAYAAYQGGNLTKVAIVNLEAWEEGATRPSTNVTLQVPDGVQNVTVQRLASTVGAAGLNPENVTWAGQVYTKANNGLGQLVGSSSESVNVQGQNASLIVNASEAVVIHIVS
ncbi:hypothetical protein EIP86_010413 [Pleurotus ostreatoroseus]|nr:hypothetical protein EIP86_010413 [Pleurotus ostreatoroseus]